jgi:type I restriction enzyme S subunit
MTPQELKNSILQLAIQGKLVEQRAEEGTAAELVEKILAAKNARSAKKNLTRSRGARGENKTSATSASPREEIPDDEKPFDIPESWEWVRLGDISSQITKGTTPRGGNVSYSDKGVGFLRAENIAGLDVLDKSNLKYIDEKTHMGALRRSILEANDILITIAGTLGRTAIVRDNDLPLNANQAVSMIRLVNAKSVSLKYIVIALNGPMIQRILTKQRKVTAIPNLTLEIIRDCLIPLPPLAEQKRIVAKIEELLPLIDRYEKAWSKLEDFNKRFPVDMQKSLLQMAIQGKLVEQRAEEGTGEELYRQIQAEKQRLIKSGKIKKEKPLPAITEDEIPFEIPDSWKWVRLSNVVDVRDGTHDTPKYVSEGVPLVTSKNLVNGTIDFATAKHISHEDSEAINIRSGVDDGDILFAMIGTIGNPVLIRKDREFSIKNMALFKPINRCLFCMEYLMQFLVKAQVDMRKSASASVQSFVSLSFLRNYLFPLPPLAEQKRIVAKLEEILPLCERLK